MMSVGAARGSSTRHSTRHSTSQTHVFIGRNSVVKAVVRCVVLCRPPLLACCYFAVVDPDSPLLVHRHRQWGLQVCVPCFGACLERLVCIYRDVARPGTTRRVPPTAAPVGRVRMNTLVVHMLVGVFDVTAPVQPPGLGCAWRQHNGV